MSRDASLVVFAGPSVSPRELRAIGPCTVLPPARQGDVWTALERRPRALLLIDGVFELQPSVWHRELLEALDSGVAVFGAASMGALRAAELDSWGMIGVGQIYRWYRDRVLVDDAEVALLHASAEHGHRPLTVPLVNVRHAAAQAQRRRVLTAQEAKALVRSAGQIFYQERLWPRVLAGVEASWSPQARERWARFAPAGLEDLKRADALEAMRAAAGFVRAGVRLPSGKAGFHPSSLVRRRHPSAARAMAYAAERPERAAELALAGLRTLLLSSWVRASGLSPSGRGYSPQEHVRLAEWALANAARLVPDGPSWMEGLAFQLHSERDPGASIFRRRKSSGIPRRRRG